MLTSGPDSSSGSRDHRHRDHLSRRWSPSVPASIRPRGLLSNVTDTATGSIPSPIGGEGICMYHSAQTRPVLRVRQRAGWPDRAMGAHRRGW